MQIINIAEDIPKLVKPILEGKADYVSEKDLSNSSFFTVKILQKLGSWSKKAQLKYQMHRGISCDANALELNVYNEYTYTLETIIQAGQNMAICFPFNEDLRPSRLFQV